MAKRVKKGGSNKPEEEEEKKKEEEAKEEKEEEEAKEEKEEEEAKEEKEEEEEKADDPFLNTLFDLGEFDPDILAALDMDNSHYFSRPITPNPISLSIEFDAERARNMLELAEAMAQLAEAERRAKKRKR